MAEIEEGKVSSMQAPRAASRLADRTFAFGRFVLHPARQILLDDATEIRLGSRAATILVALLERAGQVVTKEELLQLVWPTTTVDEGNLRVQVGGLRKLLGDDPEKPEFISNVIGRGYQFIAPVRRIGDDEQATEIRIARTASGPSTLPGQLGRIVGRERDLEGIVQLLGRQRLVTIVGGGGLGKTTIAVAAAHQLAQAFDDAINFVDLASVSVAATVPFAVAAALNVSAETESPLESLATFLRHRRILIVLDNCEHVIDAAAALAETLLKSCRELRILATSHEPLRAEGEWLHRLPALPTPTDEDLSLDEALRYPAIELFVERAASANQMFALSEQDVPFIVEICRKLDGVPLAIEIAAASVEVFGMAGLLERIEDRLDILLDGRRTGADRHRTIRAMLDWSYENLSDIERTLIARLGIFASSFTMEGAMMVAGSETMASAQISAGVGALVRKSLLYPTNGRFGVSYRLLESTRLYALERLADAGETLRLQHLHLQFVMDMLERAQGEWTNTRRSDWLERHTGILPDVRLALSFAFSDYATTAYGIRLTALALPLGLQLGLVDEFRASTARALDLAPLVIDGDVVSEMRLNIFTGLINQNQVSPTDQNVAGLGRAIMLADLTGDDRRRVEPQIALAAFNMGMGRSPEALEQAELASQYATRSQDDLAILSSHRILSQVVHFAGNHGRAVRLAKSVLAHPVTNIPLAYGGVQVDRRVSMRVVLARSYWMQGLVDQAVSIVQEAEEFAERDGPLALCQTLALATCPIYLWRGDEAAAEGAAKSLMERSSQYTLHHWQSWGRLFLDVLESRRISSALPATELATDGDLQTQTLATLTGQVSGLDYSNGCPVGEKAWCASELKRAKAVVIADDGDEALGEQMLEEAVVLARAQDALSWELRAMTDLAQRLIRNGRCDEGRSRLFDVKSRFTEGFDTKDLRRAEILIVSDD